MEMSSFDAPEILSKQDCLTIAKRDLNLKNDNDLQLLSHAVLQPSDDLVGFMGEYYKLSLKVQEKVHLELE